MDSVGRRDQSAITVGLCFLAALFEGVDLQAAGVAAPHILPLFHLTPQQAGLFFSASTLGLLVGAITGGWLADRVGRKAVLLGSLVLFGVFALSTAFAVDFSSLVALRLATGLGLGGALPNMIALAAESSPPSRRGISVALMYCGMPLGGALASAVSLFGGADWKAVFYFGGGAPLLLAPAVALLMIDTVAGRETAARSGSPGAARDPLHALFGQSRLASTLLLWVGFGFTLLVLYLLLNWLPSLVVSRGFSKPQSAMVQIAFNLGGAAGSAGVGWLLDGRRRVAAIIGSFLLTPVFLLGLAIGATSLPGELLIAAILGVGIISNQAILYAMAPWCYPIEVRGFGVGAAVAVGRFGSLVGPLIAGQLVGAGQNAEQVLLHMLPILATGACAAIILGLRPRQALAV
jgi:AAHS family 3-hydroxyphenylpropionic acid transporter